MKAKKYWLALLAVACVGCCAIPFAALLAGASGVGLLVWQLDEAVLEILLCLLPLVFLFAGYMFYRHQQRKSECCDKPASECSQTQCATKTHNN